MRRLAFLALLVLAPACGPTLPRGTITLESSGMRFVLRGNTWTVNEGPRLRVEGTGGEVDLREEAGRVVVRIEKALLRFKPTRDRGPISVRHEDVDYVLESGRLYVVAKGKIEAVPE